MDLPLESRVRFGFTTRLPDRAALRETVAVAEDLGLESLWVGDHVAFTTPLADPFVALAHVSALSERLVLGTAIYLLPLRPAAAVAKQAATLDRLSEGRFVFGVGLGGEFPAEFDACGVDPSTRGARLSESVEVLRKLWTGEAVDHAGRFWRFSGVRVEPTPFRPGGPPVWFGGRRPAALRRIGRQGDGWLSYVVTPQRYREGLAVIARAAREAGRRPGRFGTGHLTFVRMAATRERALDEAAAILGRRYAMDFRGPAARYCALGPPGAIAETIEAYREAGVRTFVLDLLGSKADERRQLESFVRDVVPRLSP